MTTYTKKNHDINNRPDSGNMGDIFCGDAVLVTGGKYEGTYGWYDKRKKDTAKMR